MSICSFSHRAYNKEDIFLSIFKRQRINLKPGISKQINTLKVLSCKTQYFLENYTTNKQLVREILLNVFREGLESRLKT